MIKIHIFHKWRQLVPELEYGVDMSKIGGLFTTYERCDMCKATKVKELYSTFIARKPNYRPFWPLIKLQQDNAKV